VWSGESCESGYGGPRLSCETGYRIAAESFPAAIHLRRRKSALHLPLHHRTMLHSGSHSSGGQRRGVRSGMARGMTNMRMYALILWFGMHSGAAQAPNHPRVPIFIELFTSEGCSSCPPADAWLQNMDATQPIPGADIVVVSEHVDYWNHDGWKDPYSSSELTERQSVYAREFGLSSPHTPQTIVNGQTELHLNDPQQGIKIFQKSAEASTIPLTIGPISVNGSSPALLRAHIDIAGQSQRVSAEVFSAIALDHAESQVLRGDNGHVGQALSSPSTSRRNSRPARTLTTCASLSSCSNLARERSLAPP